MELQSAIKPRILTYLEFIQLILTREVDHGHFGHVEVLNDSLAITDRVKLGNGVHLMLRLKKIKNHNKHSKSEKYVILIF